VGVGGEIGGREEVENYISSKGLALEGVTAEMKSVYWESMDTCK
jgi:hypothetical protein